MVTKLKSKNYIQVFKRSKNFKEPKKLSIITDNIIAQKLLMLKQGITINTKFIWTHALSQLSFTQFRPYAISFLGLVLSLTLIPKSKKTLEISLEVISSFKTSVDAMAKVLVWTVDYLENWHYNFIQKKYGRKRCLPCTHVLLSGQQFFYLYRLFTSLMTP